MKYKGIRMQLLGITFILLGLSALAGDKTIITLYLFEIFTVIGVFLSVGGFFTKN